MNLILFNLQYILLLKYFFIIRSLVNYKKIIENSYKPAILITQSCLRTYINSLIFKFNKEKIGKLPFKSTISSKILAIFCSNIDIICLIDIWLNKLSSVSVNKNNYRIYTQIYTFLDYFRLPLWLFHELKGDN